MVDRRGADSGAYMVAGEPVGAGNACGLFKRALLMSEVAGVGGACALKLTCSRLVGRCGLVSGCLAVLVDESVAAAVSSDRSAGPIFDDFAIVGCALMETAVRPTGVVGHCCVDGDRDACDRAAAPCPCPCQMVRASSVNAAATRR
jgi:hypothetical protein